MIHIYFQSFILIRQILFYFANFDLEVLHSKLVLDLLAHFLQFLFFLLFLFDFHFFHHFGLSFLPAVLHATGIAIAIGSHLLFVALELDCLGYYVLVFGAEELFLVHVLVSLIFAIASVAEVVLVGVKYGHRLQNVGNGPMATLESVLEGHPTEVVFDVGVYAPGSLITAVYLLGARCLLRLEGKQGLDHVFVTVEGRIV